MLRPMGLTMPKEVDASKNRLSHVPWVGDQVRSCYLAHGVSCIKPEFIHTNRGGGELTWYKNDDASNAVKALWNRSRFWTWSFPYQLWICIYIYIQFSQSLWIYPQLDIKWIAPPLPLSSPGKTTGIKISCAEPWFWRDQQPMYLCIYVSMYVCMDGCMYGCMYVCMCICIYIYIFVYI